ncbi:hypothetical protein [Cochleicola gelatinilyticus]|uniref:Uncharacterized protein n=1 Tax=Cochleicola gelatinilyticus TaxID=1763537 RepID=A0A167G7U7_9FLAO|nr:hypothetical protein [Cochleicola gelatinilyticus]OAB77308.1 hypothetical protein ULVI_12455 [Cochleicola gelatinilyticus]
MKKIFVILFLFSVSLTVYAEKIFHPATITLHDGDEFSGLARFNGKEHVEFKIDEEATIEELDEYLLKLITFDIEPYNTFEYVVLNDKYKLAQKIVEGPISLFVRWKYDFNDQITLDSYERATLDKLKSTVTTYNHGTGQFGSGPGIDSLFEKFDRFFLGRRDKVQVVEDIQFKFRKEARKWFADCPEIIEYTDSREWKYKDLKNIVEFYNQFCGS